MLGKVHDVVLSRFSKISDLPLFLFAFEIVSRTTSDMFPQVITMSLFNIEQEYI